jgi:hypothetical protein
MLLTAAVMTFIGATCLRMSTGLGTTAGGPKTQNTGKDKTATYPSGLILPQALAQQASSRLMTCFWLGTGAWYRCWWPTQVSPLQYNYTFRTGTCLRYQPRYIMLRYVTICYITPSGWTHICSQMYSTHAIQNAHVPGLR